LKVVALTILSALLTLFGLLYAALGVDYLAFEPSLTPNVTYRLRWGTNSGGVLGVFNIGMNRYIPLTDGPAIRRFYTVVAVDQNGVESLPGNEVLTTNRLPSLVGLPQSPALLRITPPMDALLLQSASSPAGPWKTLAVITSSNEPLQITAAPRQMFRTISTNLPPMPGGVK